MKKHTFDPLSFIAGALFLIIATTSVFTADLDYQLSEWVFPASVLVLGVGLLAASLRGMGQKTTDHRPEAEDH
jgi:hypothetical protein